MQPMTSAISGALKLVETAASSTGQQHGGDGSGQLVTEDQSRAWLVKQRPQDVDKALQTSLMSSLGVAVEPRSELRFPPSGGFYRVMLGCDVRGVTDENRALALAKAEAACTPPTYEQTENWLAGLQAACAGGKKSDTGAELALDLYAGAVARYPADVARTVCLMMALRHPKAGETNWFPTLGELDKQLSELASPRRAILQALGGRPRW